MQGEQPNNQRGENATDGISTEICDRCFSDLMQPLEAKAQQAGTVELKLRCPECEHVRMQTVSWDDARSFGRIFAAGKASLRVACDELADESFRDAIDCFVLALEADLIGPDDFATKHGDAA